MPLPRRLAVLGIAVAAVWSAASQDDAEGACTAQREAFYERYADLRDDGDAEREALLREVEDMLTRYRGRAPECEGRLREHEAYLELMNGDTEKVAETLRAYLAGPGQRASARSRVALHIQLGFALNDLGRTVEGARAYYTAASLADQAPARVGVRALVNGAATARVLGEDAASEDYLRTALALIADSVGTDGQLEDVRGHTLLSLAILTESRLDRAASEAERDSLLLVLQDVSADAISALPNRGQFAGLKALAIEYAALADAYAGRPAEGRRRLREGFDLARQSIDLVRKALLEAYVTEGRIYLMEGDVVAARASFERARAEAVRLEDVTEEARALEWLGSTAEAADEPEAAGAIYERAVALRETFRDRLGLEDWSASAFATMQKPYRGLVRVRLAQGRVRDAFLVLDRTRARYLRDLRQHEQVRRGLAPERRAEADSLRQLLLSSRRLAFDATTAPERARQRRVTSELQQQLEALTAGALPDVGPLDLGALQDTLASTGRTLVAYFVDDDRSAAFVVRPDTVLAVPLPVTTRDVRSMAARIGAPWRGGGADPAFALPVLHELYEALVAPVREHVETDAVTIVPDVETATLPFGMLTTAPADDYASASYLLAEWTIGTELASALLVERAAPPARMDVSVAALGKSTFDGEGFTWNGGPLPPLLQVPDEVDRVAEARGAEAFLNGGATEAHFAEMASRSHVVHLASHAEANAALPLYSRIAMSPSGADDGTLYLYEILETPVLADLVVLSGCETAGGGRRGGEGLVGLQYGMRAAGAGATLATLWPVADGATAELMGAFYDGLADGLEKDAALRQAQMAYLASHDGVEASPFYWAAPVLSGSTAPVPIRRPRRWLWVLLGLALAGGVAWRLHARRDHV